jgi:hypothetical protein
VNNNGGAEIELTYELRALAGKWRGWLGQWRWGQAPDCAENDTLGILVARTRTTEWQLQAALGRPSMDARVTLEAVESRIRNDTVRDVPGFDARFETFTEGVWQG